MNKPLIPVLSLILFLGSACTLHVPLYQNWEEPVSGGLSLILSVSPEQARILADGTFMGMGYEFSKEDHPLRLNRSVRELTIRLDGYRDQVIPLREIEDNPASLKVVLERVENPVPRVRTSASSPQPPAYSRQSGRTLAEPADEPEAETPPPEEEQPTIGILKLKVDPRGASLYIDNQFWGTSPQDGAVFPVRMKPGKHRLDILAPGHDPLSRLVELRAGQEETMELHLVPSPRKPGTEKEE